MLPYVGQGSAQAVEDAAVLALALNRISDKTKDTSIFLKAYELARKTRTQEVVGSGGVTRNALHLPDGLAQRERDEKFGALSNGGPNPDLLYVPNFALHRLISLRLIALSSGDHKFQAFLWQFDPEKDFLDRFDGM